MFFSARNVLGSDIDPSELTFDTLELIYEDTLTAKASAIDITGLDSDLDGMYILMLNVKGENGTGGSSLCGVSGDDTATNYNRQELKGDNTSVAASRANAPVMIFQDANEKNTIIGFIGVSPDYYMQAFFLGARGITTTPAIYNNTVVSGGTITGNKITEINLFGDQTDMFGVGTNVWLFRVKAQ